MSAGCVSVSHGRWLLHYSRKSTHDFQSDILRRLGELKSPGDLQGDLTVRKYHNHITLVIMYTSSFSISPSHSARRVARQSWKIYVVAPPPTWLKLARYRLNSTYNPIKSRVVRRSSAEHLYEPSQSIPSYESATDIRLEKCTTCFPTWKAFERNIRELRRTVWWHASLRGLLHSVDEWD